ncbi:MAG TPA: hypothetical protein VFW49_01000 [Fluviicoccus sp.]|nr:hypothetical protein [Fluviicoccus sp.]
MNVPSIIMLPMQQLPLFKQEAKHKAKWPRRNTLASRCLRLLLEGKRLTHPIFQSFTGSWRLSAVIHDLKKLGWQIEWADISPRRAGKRPIRSYWLNTASGRTS